MTVFAIIVVAPARGRKGHYLLGLFFILLAGNSAAEAIRSTSSPPMQLLSFRVATFLAVLDPLALYCFFGLFLPANRLLGPAAFAGLSAPAIFLLIGALIASPIEDPDAWSAAYTAALSIFTAIVYTILLHHTLAAQPSQFPWRQPLLATALAVAALPMWTRSVETTALMAYRLTGTVDPFSSEAVGLLLLAQSAILAAVCAHLVWERHRRHLPSHVVWWTLGAGIAVALVMASSSFHEFLQEPPLGETLWKALQRASTPLRWLIIGALLSVAVLRDNVLGISRRARRNSSRLLLALSFASLGLVALTTFQKFVEPDSLSFLEMTLLGGLLILSQGFRNLVDWLVGLVYGIRPEGPEPASLRNVSSQAASEETSAGGTAGAECNDVQKNSGPSVATGRVLVGRYEVLRPLGHGASGRVYLAKDTLLHRHVALKEIQGVGQGTVAGAMREARLAAAIEHPNVLSIYDAVPGEDAVLIVAEFAEGGSLSDRVSAEGKVRGGPALLLLREIVSGLGAIHGSSIVHRDLKPSNILLTRSGRAKIGDFGIAKQFDTRLTRELATTAVGTPAFMAPEQWRFEPATTRSDIYSVGMIVRECLEGPFPQGVDAVLERALAERPEERWQDAREMSDALAAVLDEAAPVRLQASAQ